MENINQFLREFCWKNDTVITVTMLNPSTGSTSCVISVEVLVEPLSLDIELGCGETIQDALGNLIYCSYNSELFNLSECFKDIYSFGCRHICFIANKNEWKAFLPTTSMKFKTCHPLLIYSVDGKDLNEALTNLYQEISKF